MNRIAAFPLAVAALVGCSSPPAFCGEAFCLVEKPSAISKETPAEDFNLYWTELSGRRFLIYEGNHPNIRDDRHFGPLDRGALPSGFAAGNLYGSDRGYQVVLRTTNRNWPAYVAVSAVTKNPDDLDQLVSKLRGKRSTEG